jgi:hypothetical protein
MSCATAHDRVYIIAAGREIGNESSEGDVDPGLIAGFELDGNSAVFRDLFVDVCGG